ncbi:hypothetical protein D3C71_2079100 [compost metagenome]
MLDQQHLEVLLNQLGEHRLQLSGLLVGAFCPDEQNVVGRLHFLQETRHSPVVLGLDFGIGGQMRREIVSGEKIMVG